jgi:hypothetical protein
MDVNHTNILLNIITPLIFVAVGVYANRLGCKDGDSTPRMNYYAVGTSVFIMSLATILADVHVNTDGALEGNFGWVVIYLLCIFVSIDVDRYSSWVRCEDGFPTEKKHLFRGVIIPNGLGVFAFCLYRFIV